MTVCGIKHADGVCVMGKCPYVKMCCPVVWDKRKSEPMTNEEYYTETDEELAGFLSRTCRDLLASVVEDGGSVPNEYIEEDRDFWLKWLKEKHNDNS